MWSGELAERIAYESPPKQRSRVPDALVHVFLRLCAAVVLVATALMFVFLASTGLRGIRQVGLWPLLSGVLWKPERALYGGLPLVFGTAASALGAVVLGAAPAVLAAVWVNEFAPKALRPIYRRAMEISAAIPSVVYGWIALTQLVPLLGGLGQMLYGDAATGGEGLLASAILLGVMIAPTVFLLSLDALRRVPSEYRHASLVLGASPWQTAMRVVVPSCWRGILVAVFFGFARAAGETMAVQMVIGGARKLPDNPFTPTTTISTQIIMDMQNAQPGTAAHDVLFSMALVLLTISATIVLVTRVIARNHVS